MNSKLSIREKPDRDMRDVVLSIETLTDNMRKFRTALRRVKAFKTVVKAKKENDNAR